MYLFQQAPRSQECRRVRQWLLLRMNGRIWEHGIEMMCRSPDNARAPTELALVPFRGAKPPEHAHLAQGGVAHDVWASESQDTPWLTTVEALFGIARSLLCLRRSIREAPCLGCEGERSGLSNPKEAVGRLRAGLETDPTGLEAKPCACPAAVVAGGRRSSSVSNQLTPKSLLISLQSLCEARQVRLIL